MGKGPGENPGCIPMLDKRDFGETGMLKGPSSFRAKGLIDIN